jgi:putative aldouronate transport system permease protein
MKKMINKKTYDLLLLAVPGLIFLIAFYYLPIFGLVLAFKDFKYNLGILGSPWVGFENFKFFFTSQDAWVVTRNTIGYNFIFIVSVLSVSVLIAMVLSQVKKRFAIKFYQTTMFFPYFLSLSVVAYMAYSFMNYDYGILNRLLRNHGMQEIFWYQEPKFWVAILPIINLWKSLGYNVLIFYAGIIAIDPSYYEAAKIDGANNYHIKRHIILPMIKPLIVVMFLVMIGKVFRSEFGLFYMVPYNSGALYPTTNVIDTHVYRSLKENGDIGMATAIGLYQSVVGLIVVVFSNWLIRKYSDEEGLF